ncbi:DinB family protein [Flavihumibacter profundi]|uniref:DinB family protein n=1 Tax=Flavihumibacter profundi TaxID=2716883 RepID=UPI001CC7BE46|nr:DinB family protein [Flavihumibacter profundi]MBZ5856220.1 DinB family protein [Flavihumibacter profundi]
MNSALIAEFKQESANTRKMLERVPQEHFDWKPHEKSMTLKRLALHVAEMTRWATITIKQDELDFSADYPKTPPINHTEDILSLFDQLKAEALEALENVTDEELGRNWTLKNGSHVFFTLPKGAVLRSMVFNHIIHHRGQLSVYLRMNNVAVPGLYGPSADEK